MWSDNESPIDLLRFTYLTDAIIELVQTEPLLPTTIGVFGDWGSGKSTILQHAERRLNALNDGTVCLTFNGWLFEGYEDAKSALMGNILEGLEKHLKDHRTLTAAAAALITKLLKRVNWLKTAKFAASMVLPHLTGVPVMAAIPGLTHPAQQAEKDKDDEKPDPSGLLNPAEDPHSRATIREFRKDFETLLTTAQVTRLVVIIDDLDRCLPSTVIQTLEAIRLFLFAGHTAFILGADERLVEYAVRERFPELPNTDYQVGQNYLEKLVQIPLRLPSLSESESESYLALLFAQRACDKTNFRWMVDRVLATPQDDLNRVAFTPDVARQAYAHFSEAMPGTLDADLAFAARLARQLHSGLGGSPRRLKRFLNALTLRELLARNRRMTIEAHKLAKLMVLEYIKTDQFRRFARWQTDSQGRIEHLRQLEHLARTKNGAAEPVAPASTLPDHLASWLDDPWLTAWLASDPPLGEENLIPYLTIAHDKIASLSNYASKLSPLATRLLQNLLTGSKPVQDKALKEAGTLDPADANAIYQALTSAYRETPLAGLRGIHTGLFGFVSRRPELFTDLLAFLEHLPDTAVYASTPPELVQMAGTSPPASLQPLLGRWTRSAVSQLKRNAERALQPRRP